MKTTCKVFIIISMVLGFFYIVPLIVGIFALNKLENAKKKEELTGMAVITLLFCSTIAGILMLCMSDKDLGNNNAQNIVKTNNTNNFASPQDNMSKISENIKKLKELKEQGILSEEEFEKLRKIEVDKLLKE